MDISTVGKNYGYKKNDLKEYESEFISPTLFAKTGMLPPLNRPVLEEYHSDFLDILPDVVSPFKSSESTQVTQGIGENPNSAYGYGAQGHEGIDLVNPNTEVTNPIGGINVSGYSPRGYGNWEAVIGASPEELEQMTPETKNALRKTVEEYMMSNPSDIRGLNIPGKNVSLQAHLASPAPTEPEIATGSANLTMGGTGGWAPHLHSALKNTEGQMVNILDLLKDKLR